MSSVTHDETPGAEKTDRDGEASLTREELSAQLAVLREQNQRLRDEYLRAQQQTYRRSAIGLVIIGVTGLLGGLVFADARAVLFALGGTGIFAGFLTYMLTPERFIAENVGTAVFDAVTTDRDAIQAELGLSGMPVYLPTDTPTVFIPQTQHDLDSDALSAELAPSTFFVTDGDSPRGVAMTPTGSSLYREFHQSVTGAVATDPQRLIEQLIDGLVEDFELIDGADASVDAVDGRATVEFTNVAYGPVDQTDHPVSSVLATGLSAGLEQPVRVVIESTDPPVITYRWQSTQKQAASKSDTSTDHSSDHDTSDGSGS